MNFFNLFNPISVNIDNSGRICPLAVTLDNSGRVAPLGWGMIGSVEGNS